MSEDSYKRRLRERKRRIVATLMAQGYRIHTYDSGPFHLEACKGRCGKKIRICFNYTDTNDILSVSREPVPDRCQREIWQISEDGRSVVVAKIAGAVKG
jgi:hypothetical protein